MSPDRPSDPAVDIVITNHNYARFLAEAIESACGQTHSRVKVVVVDDGSTDESRVVLRGFEDEVEVVLKERGGQASALNAGFQRCHGDILLILDADDVLRPEAAERVAAAFAAVPELSKVQFRMAVTDIAGKPTGAIKPSGHLPAPTGDQRRAELAFPFDIPWLPGGGTGFRTDAIRRILPIPEADYPRCGADWYLIHLSALLGEVAALDDVCAEYRVHGRNGYELDRDSLDLPHLRDSIAFAAATTRSLEALADQLRLDRPGRILSFADLANRLIALRLDPDWHPDHSERRLALLADAVRASARRFDISAMMKALLVAWFLLEAILPPRLARPLAELFLFPQRRAFINRLLSSMRRSPVEAGTARST